MAIFNSTEKNYNKQRAMAYIVYMMGGSYFNSSKMDDRFKNLYLHYAEMPQKRQYECESRVISSIERMGWNFLKKISELRCEITCRACGDELLMEFCTGGFEGLRCIIYQNGSFQFSSL